MLETPHVAVGAALATKLHPALAIPIAFGSHFILERVPHWNPHLNREKKMYGKPTTQSTVIVVADVVTSLALGGFVAYRQLPNTFLAASVLVSCLVAVLPDLIEGPYYFLDKKNDFIQNKWIPFKKSIQIDTSFLPGMTTQIITVVSALWWALT